METAPESSREGETDRHAGGLRGPGSGLESVATESGQTSPFLSHEWFGCCWGAAGAESRPEVLLVEDSAGPTAIVPLICRKASLHGLPARVLGMLSSPDTAFADWLIVGRPEPVVEAVLTHLSGRRD